MHPIVQRRNARGMTLVEVLTSIVIFAIGLLGIAALQVAGLRYTKGSQIRSVASLQVENMIDRMRANAVGVADGDYLDLAPITSAGSIPVCDDVNICTTAQIAQHDWGWWLSETRQALGARNDDDSLNTVGTVNATICVDSTPDDGTNGAWACDDTGEVLAIKLEWTERSIEGASGDTYSSSSGSTGSAGLVFNRYVVRFLP